MVVMFDIFFRYFYIYSVLLLDFEKKNSMKSVNAAWPSKNDSVDTGLVMF